MTKQTILVVGGAGYIGAHMSMDLLRAGYNVLVWTTCPAIMVTSSAEEHSSRAMWVTALF